MLTRKRLTSQLTQPIDIEMPNEIDVFVISSQLGNERQLTDDFKDNLSLVIKQIAVTSQSQTIIGQMREKCLDLTIQLLDVIRQQMRVFTECQDSIYAAQEQLKLDNVPSNYLDDNLDKLEREYPDIIRRIFRSFPKCCMELRKLSPRPFASKFTLESEYFVRFQFACVQIFIAWTDFELEDSANGGVRDLTQRHSKDFKKYVRQISNFQKEFLEKDFLQHIDHYRTHKFYLDFTDGHLLPSLLMKRYYEVS